MAGSARRTQKAGVAAALAVLAGSRAAARAAQRAVVLAHARRAAVGTAAGDPAARRPARRGGRAQRAGAAAELRDAAEPDPTAWVDPTAGCTTSSRRPGRLPVSGPGRGRAPFPLDQTFLLHSRPGASARIYLDFDGHDASAAPRGTAATGAGTAPTPASTSTATPATFSTAEQRASSRASGSGWPRTTRRSTSTSPPQDPGAAGDRPRPAPATHVYGTRALITERHRATALCSCSCGGVAYVGVFDDVGKRTPTTSRPGSSRGARPTTPRTSPRRPPTRSATTSASTTTAPPAPATTRATAPWAPIMGAATTGRSPVEQGRVHRRQQHRRTTSRSSPPTVRRYRADEAGSTTAAAARGPADGTAYITNARRRRRLPCSGPCSGTRSRVRAAAPDQPEPRHPARAARRGRHGRRHRQPAVGVRQPRPRDRPDRDGHARRCAAGTYYARVDGVGNGDRAPPATPTTAASAPTRSTVSGCNAAWRRCRAAPRDLHASRVDPPRHRGDRCTWTAPASDGGSPVTGLHASAAPAPPRPDPVHAQPDLDRLTPGATYPFSVAARNAIGTGPAASQAATMPTRRLRPPTCRSPLHRTAVRDGHLSPPASDGGAPITGYTLTRTGGAPVRRRRDRRRMPGPA